MTYAAEFLLPKLGADMSAGRLVEWLKQPGEPVARGEAIAVIETDKTNIDVECWTDGRLDKILVEPGEAWLPVGTPLALIMVEGEAPAPEPSAAAPVARIAASPLARRRAQELGVDLATVTGSGPQGSITLADIEQAAERAPAQPADRQARMREAIAAAMTRAKREIPHYYLSTTIDLAAALAWLEAANRARTVTGRLLPGVLLLKAAALALRETPELNGFWRDGRAVTSEHIHLGVAVSLRGGGLIAPALRDADRQGIDELMRNLQDVVMRARAGSLRSSEMTDATITVTNLGERGVETAFGIIYPPQLALVGFGKIVERPWVVDGAVVARPVVTATLSADHRASDGHRGARFLDALARLLTAPEAL